MRVLVVEDDAAVAHDDRDAPRVRRLRGGCGFFDPRGDRAPACGRFFPVVISDIYLDERTGLDVSRGRAGA